MKKALLTTALAAGIALAGFAQEAQTPQNASTEKAQAQNMKRGGMRHAHPRQRPGMGNRGELAAKIEFPQEWAALEKQRAELIAKAREKMKEFRAAVKKYRETKDEASLKLIRETMGKRYDYFVSEYKKTCEKNEGKQLGPNAAKLKERMERMIAEGKDKWVDNQIKRLLAPRKRGPRGAAKAPAEAGKAPAAAEKK